MNRPDRRLPRPSELRRLVRFRRLQLDPVRRRLDRALTIDDLRRIGRRTTPRAVFEYVDGAADGELTATRNRAAFDSAVFLPEALNPVRAPDLSTTLLGRKIALPLVFAPTGYTRMMHHEGETAVARVAERSGIPYALSTVGTCTAEQVRQAAPAGDNWFQLYLTNDQSLNRKLVDSARDAGFSTMVLTIDTAVAGRRLKDVRNGLTIPPSLSLRTFTDMSRFPYWWFNKLTTPPLGFASLEDFAGTSADVAQRMFDPGLNESDLEWLREVWPGKLLVKGILRPADAKRVIGLGADGVVVSNHGGRQLDRAPATLHALPEVRAAVGDDVTVLLDGGVRHGQDIAAAVALGADAVLAGRAYLYGLMAGGERGVARALEILRDEYQRTLQLLGLDATRKLSGSHVRL